MIFITSASEPRISFSRAISLSTSSYSAMILSRSRPVSRWSRISRMAWAWISRELELADQSGLGLFRGCRCLDQRDDRIEVVERDLEAQQDVRALLGLPEVDTWSCVTTTSRRC